MVDWCRRYTCRWWYAARKGVVKWAADRGANRMPIRRWLPALIFTLAALACQTVTGGGPSAASPYLGAFDCSGTEAGLGAYAGRVTLNADGTATFRNYDDETQTG